MDSFRRLSILSTVATFLLVAIGGLVRVTKSGLGCGDDWPDCNGRVLPILDGRPVIIEFSHRLAALAVIVLVGALAFRSLRERRSAPRIMQASIAAFALVLSQAILGMIVVKLDLHALSVALHLGTAMALAALLIYITGAAAAATGRMDPDTDRSLSRQAWLAATAVLTLMMVGSYVTGRDAGYVFPDWPLMNGRLVPDFGAAGSELSELWVIHFVHRALAVVVGIAVLAVALRFLRRKHQFPAAARLAYSAAGLFAIEILIGALNVWSGLNEIVVLGHLIVGSLVWGGLVGMAVTVSPQVRTAVSARTAVPARVALEGSG
jgi:heme a synthase